MPFTAFLSCLPLRPRQSHSRTLPSRHPTVRAVAPSPNPPAAPAKPAIPETFPESSRILVNDDHHTPPQPPPPDQSPMSYIWPRLLLLTVAAIWGTNFPVVKFLHTPPYPLPVPTAALARFTLGAVAMLPLIPGELKAANRTHFPLPFLVSTTFIGLAVSAGYFTQSIALVSTDASTSAFICSLAVVIVPIINRVARTLGWVSDTSERGILATWGAPILAVIGVGMLEFGGTPPSVGDIWAFLQASSFAMGFVLNDRLAAKYPDLVLSQSALQVNFVSVLALVWAIADSSATAGTLSFPHISDAFTQGTNAAAVMYTGFITTALTVWLENVALKKVSAGELAVFLSTEPLWAAGLAAILLGETMGSSAIAGGAIILFACVVNQAGAINFSDLFGCAKGESDGNRAVTTEKRGLISRSRKDEPR